MSKNSWVLLGALAAGLALPVSGAAGGREAALGADGEVYQVRSGAYGDLFPGAQAVAADHPVLALDVTAPGVAPQRMLVPDTADFALESSPSLLYEEDSETLFVLWESRVGIHPVLKLAGFDGARWSPPIPVVGNPFAPKTSPQFKITRDAYEEPGPGNTTVTRHRTILHLVWQEETASGTWATLYSPILITDGEYVGWNPTYDLGELLPAGGPAGEAGVQDSLLRSPTIQAGRDERTVVVAFASSEERQLATVEVDVLPQELVSLAEKARSHIIEIGRSLFPGNLQALGEKARSHVIEIGVAFHPELRTALADQVKALVLAGAGTGSLQALGEKARSHIIEIGAKLSGRGLRNPAEAVATKIVRVDGSSESGDTSGAYFLQVRVASSRPAPWVGHGAVRLFVAEAGTGVLVSWAQTDRVVYRLSRNGGWTEPRELKLTPTLDLAKAYDILAQRIRNR